MMLAGLFLLFLASAFEATDDPRYLLDEQTDKWESKGTVAEDGFWPMQEPLKMAIIPIEALRAE